MVSMQDAMRGIQIMQLATVGFWHIGVSPAYTYDEKKIRNSDTFSVT